ncbi:uncharacterized protein LOC143083223 isoform X1 [Mytilus galloprovincialis]|uniref:uncharacterized protein LOC143083223 isoform X1 n=1 Tax=Mytilus galloprovincialis TaxID=29158 RepID=UPI003F7C1754
MYFEAMNTCWMYAVLLYTLHYLGFASSELVIWYKAPLIGSYTANDVLVKTKARSKVECSAQCSKYPGCSSFEYVILTKTCSILVVSEQSFPLVNNSDICYYLPTNPATNPCYAVFCGVGTCSDGICSCPSDYYGVSCENYDPCYSVNCGVGTCTGGTCSCPSGYSGGSCQTYDPCHNINCGVGTCSGGTCSCPGGYSGSICQTYDPCYSVSCGVGTCSGGTCSCPGGYSGDSCQTYDPCYNINCGVGTCSGGNCNCPGGYSGSICQTYDPCYNVNCGVGTCSGGTCSCPDGYSGSNCQNSCPTGYDWLSSSNTCVKFYGGDYRSWANLKTACQADGADLPLLNTDTLFNDFRIYMDQKSSDRVAVDGTLSGNQGIWSNGDVLSSNRFCAGNPDLTYQSNVCLYFEDTAAGYCGTTNNRIDDSYCHTSALRICMKKL